MSSAATWDASTIIIEQFFDLRLDALCSISASVLLFYDYLLTLNKEAGLFWKRKPSGASLLFLCNRYLTLLTQMFDIVQFTANMSGERFAMQTFFCDAFSKVAATVDLCQYVPWAGKSSFSRWLDCSFGLTCECFAVFSGLRAYALSRYKSLGILVFLLSVGPDVVNLIKYAYGLSGFSGPVWAVESCAEGGADIMPLPQLSCIDYARTSSCEPKFVIISRSCLIAADVILILITWISLWKRVIYVSGKPTRLSFTKVLLRDGTVYFIIILTMNILHLAFSLPSVSHTPSTRNFSQITVFTEPITAILVSRFLIDLQEANRRPTMIASDDPLHFSTSNVGSLRFVSVVTSLGVTFSGPGASELDLESESSEQCRREGELEDGICLEDMPTTHRHTWTCSDEFEAGPSQRDARSTPSSGATMIVKDAHHS
ncbi:hypothetical protein K466DRAFT_604094 [Polyporus arcularius HHB13444]|uniref:DUF6533 domain-containing protein n=1 Tax=Polyporus arcularius HHB13444 TaxID=1314778 RepID=A0A5C3NXA7_9APHY|nr:hypothetical protein K466DRAFT_604094 [Polyporus arcularius HHB13444]